MTKMVPAEGPRIAEGYGNPMHGDELLWSMLAEHGVA